MVLRQALSIPGGDYCQPNRVDTPRCFRMKLLANAVAFAPAGYGIRRDASDTGCLFEGEGLLIRHAAHLLGKMVLPPVSYGLFRVMKVGCPRS
jgi:hypothetical protein